MAQLGRIRTSRLAAPRLAGAVVLAGCWLGTAVSGAVAQEGHEASPDSVRVLKGARWSEQRNPLDLELAPPSGIVSLKGTRWGGPLVQRPKDAPATVGTELTLDALFPALRFPPADSGPHGDPWANVLAGLFVPRPEAHESQTVSAAPASNVTVVVVPTVLPPHESPAGGNEASEAHAAATAGGPHSLAEAAAQAQPTPASAGYNTALVQFVSTAAGVLAALFMFCAGLVALRRFGLSVQFGPRSEPARPAVPPGLEPAPEAVVWEDTASLFDLGPSYEEDMRQKEATAREQEQAVLRQLFEQNVHLREQIGELEQGA
jgi:hypothetical protein